MLTAAELIAFENEVAERFNAGEIRAPVHLSGGNEEQLIEIFRAISREDWIFCSYRNHYHALLHGIPRERVMAEILAGRSQNLTFPEYHFFTSAMVGGIVPIAVGVAVALKRKQSGKVWCFVGDMAATTGAFWESTLYAAGQGLPISFVVEDNGMSCDTPTAEAWGERGTPTGRHYKYTRRWPHINTGKWVDFK